MFVPMLASLSISEKGVMNKDDKQSLVISGSTQNDLCVDFTSEKAFQLFLYKDSILKIKEFPL